MIRYLIMQQMYGDLVPPYKSEFVEVIDFSNLRGTLPPSDEGGGFLRSKKTEGEKAKSISLPQSKAELLTAPSSEGAQNTIKLPARQTPICRDNRRGDHWSPVWIIAGFVGRFVNRPYGLTSDGQYVGAIPWSGLLTLLSASQTFPLTGELPSIARQVCD